MTSQECIENLYETFKIYKLNGKIDKCPCGCITDQAEQKIFSKPLRELEADDLSYYNGKAMTTWGNDDNYKHFLPRLFEIHKNDNTNGAIDLASIHRKLDHAHWLSWNKTEQNSIIKFVESDWKEFVNELENDEIWFSDFEPYLKFIDFSELLEKWKFPDNKIALRNFVEFFCTNGNEILHGSKKIKIDKIGRREELAKLLDRENLEESLKESLSKNEVTDKEYAVKISTVLYMMETQSN